MKRCLFNLLILCVLFCLESCGGLGSRTSKESNKCLECNGSGVVTGTCRICSGHGVLGCASCDGEGEIICRTCGGTAKYGECISCEGTGLTTSFDGNIERCRLCNGTGKDICPYCAETGYVDCNVCGGDGRLTCKGCGGTGKIEYTCDVCNGTGKVN